IQATKPDSIGAAMDDSPAGLAAYIMEKFCLSMRPENSKNTEDGGLFDPKNKITFEHILTNVMVYWITRTATSSMRFYKEMFRLKTFTRPPVSANVPVGLAIFPNEMLTPPRFVARQMYKN